MKPVILSFVLVLTSIFVSGQNKSIDFPPKNHYQKGTIALYDEQIYDVKDIKIEGDSVSFMHNTTMQYEKIAVSNIKIVKVKKGSKVVVGAIIGAVIPFIFMLEPLIDNEPNDKNTGALVAGVLIGGAVVGGAIGFAIPVWRTYNFDNNKKYGLSVDYKIQANSKMLGVAIVLNF